MATDNGVKVESPKVAVVILNWNGLPDTIRCVESVLQSDYPSCQVVVVDNKSDESIDPIRERFPDVTVILNQDNLGYSGGNNVGFRYAAKAGAVYVWVLNNDTVVDRSCLSRLVARIKKEPGAGAVTNLILHMNNMEQWCWYGGGLLDGGLARHHGLNQRRCELSPPPRIDYLSGCSFLARVDVITELGGFDERFFCYSEDVDISLRMKGLGFALAYEPEAVVYHRVSGSTGGMSAIKIYYKHRNRVFLLKKHDFPVASLIRWYATSLRYVLSLTVKHHRPQLSLVLLRALWDGTINRLGKSDV